MMEKSKNQRRARSEQVAALKRSQSLRRSFEFLRGMTDELLLDCRSGLGRLQEASSRYEASDIDINEYVFHLKTLVRAFFGLVDAQTFAMRQAVAGAVQRGELKLDNRTLAKLMERRFDPGTDTIGSETMRIGTSDRVKLAFRHFPKLFAADYEFDAGNENFRGFKAMLRERNDFTHPERLEHLFPVRTFAAVKPTVLWYLAESINLFDACGEAFRKSAPEGTPEFVGFRDSDLASAPSPTEILDEDFYDKVTGDKGNSIAYIRYMVRFLGNDTARALDLLRAAGQSETQFARRTFARTFFSQVEGTIGFIRFFTAAAADRGVLALAESDSVALRSTEFSPESLVETCNIFSREFGKQHEVSTRSASWNRFRAAHRLRDQATHPRKITEVRVSDKQFQTLLSGLEWFNQEVLGQALYLREGAG